MLNSPQEIQMCSSLGTAMLAVNQTAAESKARMHTGADTIAGYRLHPGLGIRICGATPVNFRTEQTGD